MSMYGYVPNALSIAEDSNIEGEVPAVTQRLEKLKELRASLAVNWQTAIDQQVKAYNNRHKPQSVKVGDLALLSTKNLAIHVPKKKLFVKFIGPFRVELPIGKQAYRLTLPQSYKVHNVFHVSLLEPYLKERERKSNTSIFQQNW